MSSNKNNIQKDDKEYPCSPYTKAKNFTELMHAVMRNDIETVKYICENNKDEINKQNSEGWSALHLACRNSRTVSSDEIVKILLDSGANVNLQDNTGWFALMHASTFSRKESTINTVKMLIKAKANLDLQNDDGWTALMSACRYSAESSTEETVKILIDAGANLELKMKIGLNSLKIACDYINGDSSIETVIMLIMAGAKSDINCMISGQNIKIFMEKIIEMKNREFEKILKEKEIEWNMKMYAPGCTGFKEAEKHFKSLTG